MTNSRARAGPARSREALRPPHRVSPDDALATPDFAPTRRPSIRRRSRAASSIPRVGKAVDAGDLSARQHRPRPLWVNRDMKSANKRRGLPRFVRCSLEQADYATRTVNYFPRARDDERAHMVAPLGRPRADASGRFITWRRRGLGARRVEPRCADFRPRSCSVSGPLCTDFCVRSLGDLRQVSPPRADRSAAAGRPRSAGSRACRCEARLSGRRFRRVEHVDPVSLERVAHPDGEPLRVSFRRKPAASSSCVDLVDGARVSAGAPARGARPGWISMKVDRGDRPRRPWSTGCRPLDDRTEDSVVRP